MIPKVASDSSPIVSSEAIPIPKSCNNLSPRYKDRSPLGPDLFVETMLQSQSQRGDVQYLPRASFLEDETTTNLKDAIDRISEKTTSIYPGASNHPSDKFGNVSIPSMSKSDSDSVIIPTGKHSEIVSEAVNIKRSYSANERKPSSINHFKKDELDDPHFKNVSKFRNHDQLKLNFTNLDEKETSSSSDSSMGKGDKTLPLFNRQKNRISPRHESYSSFSSSSPTSSSSSSTQFMSSQKKSPSHRSSDSPHRKSATQHGIASPKRRINVEDSTPITRPRGNTSLAYLKLGKINQKRNSCQEDSLHNTNRQTVPAKGKENYLLPEKFLAEHNACIKKSMVDYTSKLVSKEVVENNFSFDLGPVLVDKVYADFNDVKFEINEERDDIIYKKLKSLLIDINFVYCPVKEEILEFCSNALNIAFLEDQITFGDYRNTESKRISKLLDVIQSGGLILEGPLSRLLLLREKLLAQLSLESTYTHFSVDLYKYLLRLTDLDTFSMAEKGFEKGKKLSDFLKTIDEMLNACKEMKVKYQGGGGKVPRLKLINSSNSKIELVINPIKELLLTAIGGSVEGGLKLLEEYRFWAIPGEGGQSASSQMLHKYCRKTALFLDDVQRIFHARHYCFIEDLYSAESTQDPEGKHKCEDIQKVSLFKTSYANDSIENVCRSLKQDTIGYVYPSKITVKGGSKEGISEVIHEADQQPALPPLSDPFPNFWTVLIASFYSHGFGEGNKVSEKSIKLEAHTLKSFYKHRDKLKEMDDNGVLINKYEKIPTLKILELMTIKCNQIAGLYLDLLFPKFYTPYGSEPSSPYYIEDVKKSWEINVKIINSNEFKVTHKKKFNVFAHDNRNVKICTGSYSWTNKTAVLKDETNPLFNIKGWEGVFKLTDFEFFDTSHSKDLMLIFSKPNDVSSRTDLPLGLQFTTMYKKF